MKLGDVIFPFSLCSKYQWENPSIGDEACVKELTDSDSNILNVQCDKIYCICGPDQGKSLESLRERLKCGISESQKAPARCVVLLPIIIDVH